MRFFARPAPFFVLCGLFLLAAPRVHAQELDCTVEVDIQQLSGTGFTFLNDLRLEIQRYMNQHTWTEHRFEKEERIQCSMQLIFEEALTLTSFRARLIVTSVRPIYGTTQNTRVFQVQDGQWQFEYAQGQPLVFEIERYEALTSVLDFYAYMMIGYDFDTFSELGGAPYFQKARRIAELAQVQNATGWNQIGDDRNRSALITQVLDPRLVPLRKAYFTYHYGGLDHFVTDTQAARQAVLGVLESLQTLYEDVSRQYVIDIFFGTKYEELSALFKESPLSSQAYGLLSQVDPSHLSTYNQLVN